MRIYKITAAFSLLIFSFASSAQEFGAMDIIGLFGVTGFFIVLMSLVALAVVFERFTSLKRSVVVPNGLSTKITTHWKAGEFDQIDQLCESDKSVLAKVYSHINKHKTQSVEMVSTGAGDIASMQLRKHLEKAYPLAVVSTIAPLAGLLGTVIGMIEAFYVVAATGALGDASILADGIYKALFTTAAGLIVALPALGFHHFFKSKVTFYGLAIEEQVNNFISDHFVDQPSDNGQHNHAN